MIRAAQKFFGAPVWLLGAVVACMLASPAGAQEQPFWRWFKYQPTVTGDWDIVGDPANPLQVSMRPKIEQKGPLKRVLVLYPRASSAYDIAITKILKIFDDKELNAHITAINFELKDARGKEVLKFAENGKFDLIFSMGSESTAWLFDNYLGGSIPVVSVCSKDPVQLGQTKDYEQGTGNNFAFTSLNMPVEVQLAYLVNLKPDLKNIAILVDNKNISAVQTQAEPVAAHARKNGIQVIMGSVQSPEKAREELAKIVPDAIRQMRVRDPDLSNSVFLVTGSTSVFKEMKIINEYAGRVPVVSMIPEIVTSGSDTAVVAMGISFESNAHLAAIYGADILSGRSKAGTLKVGIVSPPDISISFAKAREIGLRVPFTLFETASFVYDYEGKSVRTSGRK
jgi:putative ABC transport system substrate-binding protein